MLPVGKFSKMDGWVGAIVASFVGKSRFKRINPRKVAGIVLLLGFGQGAGQHVGAKSTSHSEVYMWPIGKAVFAPII